MTTQVVLGSNGIFEFLTNQTIVDICAGCSGDPELASERILERAYGTWWDQEGVIDDITVIVIFIDRMAGSFQPANVQQEPAVQDTVAAEANVNVDSDLESKNYVTPTMRRKLQQRGVAPALVEAQADYAAVSSLSDFPFDARHDEDDSSKDIGGSDTSVQDLLDQITGSDTH